jgi:hypothetical protein
MKPGLQFERIALEALVAAAVGAAAVAGLYSNWWSSCCKTFDPVVSVPFLPGMYVAMIIDGGPHGAERYHVYIGVAAEFFALWLLFRLFIAPRLRRTPSKDV